MNLEDTVKNAVSFFAACALKMEDAAKKVEGVTDATDSPLL